MVDEHYFNVIQLLNPLTYLPVFSTIMYTST